MTARDSEIRAAIAERETRDVKIAQKVNAAHREAFRERFPGQIEHSLRLVAERLQACLGKPEGWVPHDVQTWPATPETLLDLSRSLESLFLIYQQQQDDR